MKSEFSISKEVASKIISCLENKNAFSIYSDGKSFIISDKSGNLCSTIKYDFGEGYFPFCTTDVELLYSVLKNSEEFNFLKTNQNSFLINGIKLKQNDNIPVSSGVNFKPSDYLLVMTKEDFDFNFSLFDYTRISRVINNEKSGVSLIFGNKTIQLTALDYSTISLGNIRGEINEAEVNNLFKHDKYPATFNEDDINFFRKFIEPDKKVYIFMREETKMFVFSCGDVSIEIPHISRSQTTERIEVYNGFVSQAKDFITFENSTIFDFVKLLSDCKVFESLEFTFVKGQILISSNCEEVAKIKDKNVKNEEEIKFELNSYSLFNILKHLKPNTKITIRKIEVETDVYFNIINSENDFSFILIG